MRAARIALAFLWPWAVFAQAQVPEWRVSPTPMLVLEENGTPATEFHRIAGAFRLPNGNVVVANGGVELRIFDSKGALVETFGRKGKGPGEFERMRIIEISGDTALLYDGSTRRVTTVHFGDKARVVTEVTMIAGGVGFGFEVEGRLADGRWLGSTGMGTPGGWEAPKGVSRIKGKLGFVQRDGRGVFEPFVEVPSFASITYMPSDDKKKWATGIAALSPFFMAKKSGGAIWFGESGSDSLVRMDAAGRRRVVIPMPSVPVTPQVIAASRPPAPARGSRRAESGFDDYLYSEENLPKKLPHFGGLVFAADGGLWVQEYAPPAATAAALRYLALDSQGRAIGRVATPAGFRATHAGSDFIVGTTRDADGVEGVRVLRIERR
jgi:hypothetical protein